MNVPLLDLRAQFSTIKEEVLTATMEVYESQRFIMGPKVEELEHAIAAYTGARHAVGVSSGTDALLISLMSAYVGPGDLVITSPYTFFSTAGSIARLGATPVFVDIDEHTYNMDPEQLDEKISSMKNEERSRIKAIIPVHLFGQCADMDRIGATAKSLGSVIIEDAAQAIGAEYQSSDGSLHRAGSMGAYGCFSFFPSKNLGSFGDAGMVTTGNNEVYERLSVLRLHGSEPKYYHKVIGGNFRLDALQAAILLVKLNHLDQWTEKRRENARTYRALFADKGLEQVELPYEHRGRHIYNQFVIKVGPERDGLRAYLSKQGIGTEVYYPVPLHAQECFSYLGYRPEDCPVATDAAARTLALPIYPELEYEQLEYIVDSIYSFYKAHKG
ncbi:MAG: DegT/DnrJ/EryC1/StrS family aminotransferase [Deltaproteobacteria bacterium]|nr:MAG: DegT/DnrJ/EryC1/StrS family aminotransferase [Deltaproteobacteria bacterium]